MSEPTENVTTVLQELGAKTGTIIPTTANVSENGSNGYNDASNMLKTLEGAFWTPMLSLLKIYLQASNGTKKTIENCLLDFRTKHARSYVIFFVMDFVFRLVYMTVLLLVVIRGLGIGEYLLSLGGGR
jgi:hypothetical protein